MSVALRPLNVLALCAGSGGVELGLSLATGGAARAVCYVEREAYLAEVLARRMEEGHLSEAPIHSDLKTFDARPWRGVVDIVTAGYPCQPFSAAGKRLGRDDPRHLWPHVARLIRAERGPGRGFVPTLLATDATGSTRGRRSQGGPRIANLVAGGPLTSVKRGGPLKRGPGPKRKAWLSPRGKPSKEKRARKAERYDRLFGRQAELARSFPCCVCGRQPTEAAHVRSRGAGGTARDIVPLCKTDRAAGREGCHDRQHRVGIKTFQAQTGVDLVAEAARLAEEVSRGRE